MNHAGIAYDIKYEAGADYSSMILISSVTTIGQLISSILIFFVESGKGHTH
jgi:hypothetical protein